MEGPICPAQIADGGSRSNFMPVARSIGIYCRRFWRGSYQSHRVIIGDDPTDADAAAEAQTASSMGIQRFIDPLMAMEPADIHSYANAVTQIVEARNENKPVLVHCSSGAQRSNGATFYYRVLVQHWNADDAAREMIRNGHSPRSNPALIPYLNSHMREIAGILAAGGVIDHVPDPLPQIKLE